MSTDVQDTLAPPDSANSTMTFTRTFIQYLVLYRNIPVIAGEEVNRGWSAVPWQHMANLVDLTVQPSTTTLTLISTTLTLALLEMCGQNRIIAI